MSDTTPPEWAMTAAEEIARDVLDSEGAQFEPAAFARIIAEHAPKVRSDWIGDDDVKRLATPFGTYLATQTWWANIASATFEVGGMDEAIAAARADFEWRVRECHG